MIATWNGRKRTGTARVATDEAQMTGQLCNYIEARTTAQGGQLIVQVGQDMTKTKKPQSTWMYVCNMTTLSTCNDTKKSDRMMWQSLNLPSTRTCSWTATKHFSNDFFAHNYLLITRRTYAGPFCKGIWCKGMRGGMRCATWLSNATYFNTYNSCSISLCPLNSFWEKLFWVKMHFRLSHLATAGRVSTCGL